MNITEDIHELVGRTPLIHLTHLGLPEGAQIYAKAELLNPGGSIKDRLGEHIIRKAEADGRLAKGGTILEITAGNTGIGLAFAALNRGYRLILIVPCCYSKEKQIVMRALGAEVVTVPAEDGLPGARKMAEKLQWEISGSYFVDQFDNPDNPETYYETLGPEIYDQLDGKIDWFVTGGRLRRNLFRNSEVSEGEESRHSNRTGGSEGLHYRRRRAGAFPDRRNRQ